jgi:hypothetical protein
MKNNRLALWLLLASQLVFALSSLIEPPRSLVTTIVRLVLPLALVVFISLVLAGFISPKK